MFRLRRLGLLPLYFLADGPFFCPRCWEAVDANARREENRGLAEFAGAGGGA